MRTPLEYGDNFPVPSGSWSPTIPWRFPKVEEDFRRSWLSTRFHGILPWLMLVLGIAFGVAWMSRYQPHPVASWRASQGPGKPGAGEAAEGIRLEELRSPVLDPVKALPEPKVIKGKSRLA